MTNSTMIANEKSVLALIDQSLSQVGKDRSQRIETARAGFVASGLPGRRLEKWRYSDLRSVMPALNAADPVADDIDSLPRSRVGEKFDAINRQVRLVNGKRANDDAASFTGVTVTAMDGHPDRSPLGVENSDGVTYLNQALSVHGHEIKFTEANNGEALFLSHENSSVDGSSAKWTHDYGQVIVERAANATLVETISLADANNRSHFKRIELADEAKLSHIIVADVAADSICLDSLDVTLGERAEYTLFIIGGDGKLSRMDINLSLTGNQSIFRASSANVVRRNRHFDITMEMRHDCLGSVNQENMRYIIDDRAKGVFQGKIVVLPDAQKTDGKMMARSLLCGERSEFDVKPELEIYADDVLCGHGATSSSVDETALFYLTSRGIKKKQAQSLLREAFLAETLDHVPDDYVEILRDEIKFRLNSI